MEKKELQNIIQGCRNNNGSDQEQLFKLMYNYGMSIASRYGDNLSDSEDIANEAFYKMFKSIHSYQDKIPFKLWLRKIIINCGIDHYRKSKGKKSQAYRPRTFSSNFNQGALDMESEYLLAMIRKLTPQYRIVFVMHVIEGFSHEEVSEKLNISKGTSKSNLSKARKKLQEMILIHNQQKANYGI